MAAQKHHAALSQAQKALPLRIGEQIAAQQSQLGIHPHKPPLAPGVFVRAHAAGPLVVVAVKIAAVLPVQAPGKPKGQNAVGQFVFIKPQHGFLLKSIANEPKVSFRDGHYYVFDGQHTIVARKHMNGNNDLPILCKVYYGMTEAEEALLFAMQTGYSAALTPSAKLRANLRGEDKASGEFYDATEEAGLHMGFERGGGTGRIICINTAFAEFKRVGAEVYKEALTLLLEAWGGDPDSLRAEIIQGIVHFVELYHGEYDRERLIYSLRAYEPKFVYAAGKAEKELRGVKRYVNIFYRIYNGRRKHSTLPMKF